MPDNNRSCLCSLLDNDFMLIILILLILCCCCNGNNGFGGNRGCNM